MLFHQTDRLQVAVCADRAIVGLLSVGWAGVDLFFVLSGFLITGILYDSKESQHFFRNFYLRRVLRIFPLYYGALLVVFVIAPHMVPNLSSSAAYQTLRLSEWSFWTYLVNYQVTRLGAGALSPIGHFWSLGVEEQFYLIWPLVVFLCSRRMLLKLCVGGAVVALVYRAGVRLLFPDADPFIAQTPMPASLDLLGAGAWLALATRGQYEIEQMRRLAKQVAIATGAALGLISLRPYYFSGRVNAFGFAMQTVGYSLLAVFFASLIALTLHTSPGRTGTLNRVFSTRALRFLGRYSYALYVFHVPVQRGLEALGLEPLLGLTPLRSSTIGTSRLPGILAFIAIVSAASIIPAFLSWHLYEKHFLKLKRYFPRKEHRA
jgi:peptidoglycan/LPS O-acetylase OafA/YrhL